MLIEHILSTKLVAAKYNVRIHNESQEMVHIKCMTQVTSRLHMDDVGCKSTVLVNKIIRMHSGLIIRCSSLFDGHYPGLSSE